jgi:AraC-like DNA-binding protein
MLLLSVSEKILGLVTGLGILQGVLLAALVYFHPKSDRSVNLFLSLYILTTSAVMTIPFAIRLVGWQNNFYLVPVSLLPGPFLYFYLKSFKERITWKKVWPHFMTALVFLGLAYWNLSGLSKQYPNAKDVPIEVLSNPFTLFITVSKSVIQILYYFLSRNALISYQRSIHHLFSETSRINMNWARYLVSGYLVLNLLFLVIFPLILRFPDYFHLLLLSNMTVAVFYIYVACYKGVTQPSIWQAQSEISKETAVEEMHEVEVIVASHIEKEPKEIKAHVLDSRLDSLTKRITALMENEKFYQETELTLHQLATKLEVPTYQVSQALNDGLKKNFYDLVNGYRVEEAKRLLLDSKNRNYTILSVGFEAGFNSKTTFNTVFKKFTGLTPTDYRDKEKAKMVNI